MFITVLRLETNMFHQESSDSHVDEPWKEGLGFSTRYFDMLLEHVPYREFKLVDLDLLHTVGD